MDTAAALLNDTEKQRFTYTIQLPYMKKAFRELRQLMESVNIPKTNRVAEMLAIPSGTSEISYVTTPALPADLVEIRQLWERPAGINPWTPMQRLETLPYSLDGAPTANFILWAWIDNKIHVLPTTQDNDLNVDYIAQLANIVDQNTEIDVINGQTFLENRVAALCAQYISEDTERANDLNGEANNSLNVLEVIETKAKQAIFTRRRPFRQSWKTRTSGGLR
jgi:hypothetical protein